VWAPAGKRLLRCAQATFLVEISHPGRAGQSHFAGCPDRGLFVALLCRRWGRWTIFRRIRSEAEIFAPEQSAGGSPGGRRQAQDPELRRGV